MSGLAELAAVMMQGAERRIDVTASNVSNMSTPGYRSRRVYSQIMDQRSNLPAPVVSFGRQASAGAFRSTGNPTDLATDTAAVLILRDGDAFVQTRSVQFRRDEDGRLVDGQGRTLQAVGGGDVITTSGNLRILADGTLLVEGQPEGKIGLFTPVQNNNSSLGAFASDLTNLPEVAQDGVVHQGMIVAADVDLASEMVDLNRASRMAETGAKVFQLYDDLTSRAATLLGDTRK